ncbi:hypothetical protein [Leminorella grimontii]|uniref:hypothetical protein n=1 Tax=Leminorella grimontii TaxID=82981 RepID=UPI00321FAAA2
MSNDVCGYIVSSITREEENALTNYFFKKDLGLQQIPDNELYNFPVDLLPKDSDFIFLIGDRPGYPNATYLIDYLEYDPESSDIGFPSNPKERLNILLDALVDMIKITNAEKMVVALTDCNQIEAVKKINLSEIYDVIHADFEKYRAPPDTLYEIIV